MAFLAENQLWLQVGLKPKTGFRGENFPRLWRLPRKISVALHLERQLVAFWKAQVAVSEMMDKKTLEKCPVSDLRFTLYWEFVCYKFFTEVLQFDASSLQTLIHPLRHRQNLLDGLAPIVNEVPVCNSSSSEKIATIFFRKQDFKSNCFFETCLLLNSKMTIFLHRSKIGTRTPFYKAYSAHVFEKMCMYENISVSC